MTEPRDIIKRPVISEKSYALIEQGKYTFEVPIRATKVEVRQAVEAVFGVKVTGVNTSRVHGKVRSRSSRGGARIAGSLPDWKKVVVSLREGDEIAAFKAT